MSTFRFQSTRHPGMSFGLPAEERSITSRHCFGLSTAPQVFTRVMTPMALGACSHGIHLFWHLDDWLILAGSVDNIIQDRDRLLLLLCEDHGIKINRKKSDLSLSRRKTYLGMVLDTEVVRAFPSTESSSSSGVGKDLPVLTSSHCFSLAVSSRSSFVPREAGSRRQISDEKSSVSARSVLVSPVG